MTFSFKPMTAAWARMIVGWRYPEPYTLYNAVPTGGPEDTVALLDPDYHYYALLDAHTELVAYCCFGEDAQVRGGDYSTPALDVGVGMRPDTIGQGAGSRIIQAALAFGERIFVPSAFRVTVAAFNQRAQRACLRVGFHQVACFPRPGDGQEFVVLLKHSAATD